MYEYPQGVEGGALVQDSLLLIAWEKTLKDLREIGVNPANMAALEQIKPLGRIESTVLFSTPNSWIKDLVESRLIGLVTTNLSTALSCPVRIALTVETPLESPPTVPVQTSPKIESFPHPFVRTVENRPVETVEKPVERTNPESTQIKSPARKSSERQEKPRSRHEERTPLLTPGERERLADKAGLNPKYTFESFVIGPSNRFAHAAAEAIAEAPAMAYNPLFIYGGSGLGKTHLLHAIGNYAIQLNQRLHVQYVNSEEFTNDFINSIRQDKIEDFQHRYRAVDLLLIDDIQFIQGKEQTMEEFFHTFNSLYNANKQIVITSDLPPKSMPDLEDRLRSRFEWGLLTDVQPPETETRAAILLMKSAAEGLEVPNEVANYIARHASSNIRELEGLLVRVGAYANLSKSPITEDLARMALKDLVVNPEETVIHSTLILGKTAEYFELPITELTGRSRTRVINTARQIAMYLCREMTSLSLPKIGERFGGRDHTTVINAIKKIKEQMNEEAEMYNHINELTTRIKQEARNQGREIGYLDGQLE